MSWPQNHTVLGGATKSNYYGDGSDGDIRITSAGAQQSFNGGVTWSVILGWTMIGNTVMVPSVQDGDMVVVNARNVEIGAGIIFATTNRCRGLLIYGFGNARIDGIPSMTARGCHADPADAVITSHTPVAPSDGQATNSAGLTLAKFAAEGTQSGTSDLSGCGLAAYEAESNQPPVKDGVVVSIPRVGGPGASGATSPTPENGEDGQPSPGNAGGGGGGGSDASSAYPDTGGRGGNATCWSGGPGGGASYTSSVIAQGDDGDDYGGPGGDANVTGSWKAGGGAGNLAGTSVGVTDAEDGTGGLFILCVRGDVTGSGTFESKGSKGGGNASTGYAGGGGSGGGRIVILYGGQWLFVGFFDVSGGDRGEHNIRWGGKGAPGSWSTHKIDQ